VITSALTCVHACATASDRLACVTACAADARSGATACADDFATCLAACSPTTTTLPKPFCGPDPASGTCGGTCPPGFACLAPPPGSGIPVACLCRPAGAPCQTNTDCLDGNPCTLDLCALGTCIHECMCFAPGGGFTCCPGPAGSCGSPSGAFL